MTLTDRATRSWPTPTAADGARTSDRTTQPAGRGQGPSLSQAATWATPQARDDKGPFTAHRRGGKDLAGQVTSGPHAPATTPDGNGPAGPVCLNPPFVEWLMGWPIGWTDCTRSATASYHSWLQQHSTALHAVLASTCTTGPT